VNLAARRAGEAIVERDLRLSMVLSMEEGSERKEGENEGKRRRDLCPSTWKTTFYYVGLKFRFFNKRIPTEILMGFSKRNPGEFNGGFNGFFVKHLWELRKKRRK